MPYLVPKSLTNHKMAHIQLTNEKLTHQLVNNMSWKDFIKQLTTDKHTLSFDELHTNAPTLIVAGSKTTATAMARLTYFLLLQPEKLQKVMQEVQSVFEVENGIEISMTTINHLPYLGVCIDKTLQLYPPISFGVPQCMPGNGYMLNGKWVSSNIH